MFVIPKAGMHVRDPVKRDVLPDEGREVGERTAYWRRRVADGDCTEKETPAPKSTAAKKGSDTV